MANSVKLKDAYSDWIFKEYSYEDIEKNIVKIGTPFLDNQFDYIIMYAEFLSNDKIRLTDDGWTINDLESQGLTFSGKSKSRNELLNSITNSLGIDINNKELTVTTDIDKFPIVKQRLLQAILQVNDLIILKDDNFKSTFFDEIKNFLIDQEIFYSLKPSYPGKGGITIQFDFSVPNREGEKLIRTIRNGNDLNRTKLFTIDTQLLTNRDRQSIYHPIFDDISNPIKNWNSINSIFSENEANNIIPLTFSQIQEEPNLISNQA